MCFRKISVFVFALGAFILSMNVIVKADTHPRKLLGYISGQHLRCYDPERNKVFSHQPYSMTTCGGDSYRISEKDYQRFTDYNKRPRWLWTRERKKENISQASSKTS